MDSIVTGVLFALMVLFMPETNFERPETTENGGSTDQAPILSQEKRSHLTWWQSLSVMGFYDR